MTLLAAAATLLKGTADQNLSLMGEAVRSITDDLLAAHFPDERATLLTSIEAAFDQPVPPDRQPLSIANEVLYRFVRDIHNEDPDAMAVLDTLTARVQQEQEAEATERQAALMGMAEAGLDEDDLERVGEAVGEIVRDLRDRPPGPSETTREIVGPRGERIVIRVVSGIATEPDEDDQETHDTPEIDTSDEENDDGEASEEATTDHERSPDDDAGRTGGGAGGGEDDDLQAGEAGPVTSQDA